MSSGGGEFESWESMTYEARLHLELPQFSRKLLSPRPANLYRPFGLLSASGIRWACAGELHLYYNCHFTLMKLHESPIQVSILFYS